MSPSSALSTRFCCAHPQLLVEWEVSLKYGSILVSPQACKATYLSPTLTTPTTATTADLSKACLPLMEMAPRQSGIVPAKARWCAENSSPETSFRCSE